MVNKVTVLSLLLAMTSVAWAGEYKTLVEDTQGSRQSYQVNSIQDGDLNAAERKLRSRIAQDPHDPYALLNLAYICQQSGRYEQARALYERVLELRSNPLAELPTGKPVRVKRIAQRGIDGLAAYARVGELGGLQVVDYSEPSIVQP